MAEKKTAKKSPSDSTPTTEAGAEGAVELKGKSENDPKVQKQKALDASADFRNATGGQQAAGSHIPAAVGEEDAPEEVNREELAKSSQPKAPTGPLEDIQDEIEGTEPPKTGPGSKPAKKEEEEE